MIDFGRQLQRSNSLCRKLTMSIINSFFNTRHDSNTIALSLVEEFRLILADKNRTEQFFREDADRVIPFIGALVNTNEDGSALAMEALGKDDATSLFADKANCEALLEITFKAPMLSLNCSRRDKSMQELRTLISGVRDANRPTTMRRPSGNAPISGPEG